MSQQPSHNGQYVRRVVLPSGRAIEVVYFETLADEQIVAAVPAAASRVRDLHVCPECDRDLVYPVEWEEVSPTHWEVLLRCPNCEWTEVGTFDQPTVDRFDEKLDIGTEILIRDLKRLEQANMEDEIEVFVRALGADAILPEDFS
jgi:hypothetical protein